MFRRMLQHQKITPEHAFYLGYEMAKAVTALTLGKNYVQDQALRWGFLTRPEGSPQESWGHAVPEVGGAGGPPASSGGEAQEGRQAPGHRSSG